MNVYYKNNQEIKYTKNLRVIRTLDYVVDTPFCLSEENYKLYTALNKKGVVEGTILKVGRSKITLLNESVDDLPLDEAKWHISVKVSVLKDALKFTDAVNPKTCGVCIYDNGLVISTNGFSLYCNYKDARPKLSENYCILSAEFINAIASIPTTAEYVNIYFDGIKTFAKIEKCDVIGRVVDTNYFDTSKIIDNYVQEIVLNNVFDLKEYIRLGDLIASDLKFVIFNNNEIVIKGVDSSILNEDFESGFKIKFEFKSFKRMLDTLKPQLELKCCYTEELRPMIFEVGKTRIILLPVKEQ